MLRTRRPSRIPLICLVVVTMLVGMVPLGVGAVPDRSTTVDRYRRAFEERRTRLAALVRGASGAALQPSLDDFELVGHLDFGSNETNGDVWVQGTAAYVGTWAEPCTGHGVKIVDVSNPAMPTLVGNAAGVAGTSAEDVVVRAVSTPSFHGDLLVAGIQRCDFEDAELDDDMFGVEIWDVSNPAAPVRLGGIGITTGGGGVHELDLIDRGTKAYVAAATPFSEENEGIPEVSIIEVTDPANPSIVGQWGAIERGLVSVPLTGQGGFAATFAHSARFSADGNEVHASYWDLGVVTLDVTDPTAPTMIARTIYPDDADGDTHSVAPYGSFLLANDEDTDPLSPATIRFPGGSGVAPEAPYAKPLWRASGHELAARVARPRGQGCERADYAGLHARGRIAVPRTFIDRRPDCRIRRQELVAQAAGAAAVVHDWISSDISPQGWFDFSDRVRIPVLFAEHRTVADALDAGRARLIAQQPAWGFLRVFDAATGEQVATFDDLPHVRSLRSPEGIWSIHNTEVDGDVAFSSWYTHGVVALDLSALAGDPPGDPLLVGQFVPEAGDATAFFPEVPIVWGVYPRASDDLVFASDILSGLWIVRPIGDAAP